MCEQENSKEFCLGVVETLRNGIEDFEKQIKKQIIQEK